MRASKKQKKQKTPKGHEIPVPNRSDFLRDLKKVAKAQKSPTRSPKK
ncbi:MAG: hypothetical protein Q8Q00_05300 [Dehalococcoidia bacterium]|nr:hypothetical protein [Dehalococcoidia bacterium]